MALLRLCPGPDARISTPSPEIVADILWAAAVPADGLEHIRARHGPTPTAIDLALFHIGSEAETVADIALRLCRRAIDAAPALAGWTATRIPLGTHYDAVQTEQVPHLRDFLPQFGNDHHRSR
ncbi:hypothetical protein ABH920_000307 [Catenulispora sp. EB89]|uniref:hypothetical protein n=1 Tax=Catenulispora sp. EB89 TaxID=3156257 RepID=UPI003512CC0A